MNAPSARDHLALRLGDDALRIETLVRVSRAACASVELSAPTRERVRASEARLGAALARGERVYGVNTGCGALDGEHVDAARSVRLQRNLLRSHAAGVGEPMSREAARAMIITRVNTLCRGDSAVRLETLDALLALIARDVTPWVPSIGSVGVSDLCALAHVGLLLIGEGRARVGDGPWLDGARALEQAGLAPVVLAGRDGMALINGPSQTLALAALCVVDVARLLDEAEATAALSGVALGDAMDFLAPELSAHGSAGLARAASNLRALLAGAQHRPTHQRAALSLRCMPEVAGAARDAHQALAAATRRHLDASIDNPLFGETLRTNNAGHMHSQALALGCDQLRAALVALGSISERRTARMVDGAHCDLPRFLVAPSAHLGECSGLMIASYTAAALVAELRVGSAPASVHSLPLCAAFEDHGSMSSLCARLLVRCIEQVETLVSIELCVGAQAFDLASRLRTPPPELSPALAALHGALRARVPFAEADRVVADDIAAARVALTTLVAPAPL